MTKLLRHITERLAKLCGEKQRRALLGQSASTSAGPGDAQRSVDPPSAKRATCPLRRCVIGLIGSTVVLIGIAMIVLPGPAVVVIPAGLAILATEFIWARRALRRCKGAAAKVRRQSGLAAWLRRRRLRTE